MRVDELKRLNRLYGSSAIFPGQVNVPPNLPVRKKYRSKFYRPRETNFPMFVFLAAKSARKW
jgi:hypothetical protein